jgi:hypothetical protein
VEKQMVKSLKEIIEKAVDSYWNEELLRWVLDFPGQVICILVPSKHLSLTRNNL